MSKYTAILLAAGSGSRFDPSGKSNKLLEPLTDGCAVAVTSAANLLAIMPNVLAVVRPGSDQLHAELRAIGCDVTVCPQASEGMGASLAHALAQTSGADGWLVALADMPYLRPGTIKALLEALQAGADIAAPVHNGRRGNPVAFGRAHLSHLLGLSGDTGARSLLQDYPLQLVEVNDPGVHLDIDLPRDLPFH
ncbi:MAG: nucleotidyltransferase family protein [Noviherbaspirillum sp.]